jgi:predicted nucleic-acid-binding protein
MVAIDSNIAVRLLVNDDPSQTGKAAELFKANKIFIPKSVILETEWVLRGAYNLERETINRALRSLISLEQVTAENETILFDALDSHLQGMDFADALHLASSSPANEFATFDAKFRTTAQKLSLKPAVVAP